MNNQEQPNSFIEAIVLFSQQLKEMKDNISNVLYSWGNKQGEMNENLKKAMEKIEYIYNETRDSHNTLQVLLEEVEKLKKKK